jgi:solute carrier family 25 protein 39/40
MLARDVPFSGLYWLLFEEIKKALKDIAPAPTPTALVSQDVKLAFVSGAAAGGLAAFVTTPFDVLKTRQQVEAACTVSKPECKSPGVLNLVSDILRTEGPQRLFAGSVPRTLRVAPACAIMIGSYELTKHILRNARENTELA